MLSYRCPSCACELALSVPELDEVRTCPECGSESRCPPDAYQRSRLRALAVVLERRPLSAVELREAAVHYRALGQGDLARRADRAAEHAGAVAVESELEQRLARLVGSTSAPVEDSGRLAVAALVIWLACVVVVSLWRLPAGAWLLGHGLTVVAVLGSAVLLGLSTGWIAVAGLLTGAPTAAALTIWLAQRSGAPVLANDTRLARLIAALGFVIWLIGLGWLLWR